MSMSFVWTVFTLIALKTLEILMPSIDSVNIYIIIVSAFQNFLRIENPLNIKKVMGRNVWMCFDSNIDSLDKHSIQCIACFDLCIDSADKKDTILNTQ